MLTECPYEEFKELQAGMYEYSYLLIQSSMASESWEKKPLKKPPYLISLREECHLYGGQNTGNR